MIKRQYFYILAGILAITLFLSSCKVRKNQQLSGNKTTVENKMATLNEIPDQLKINGNKIKAEVYLWRDFQPISPPEGKPLRVVVKIRDEEGKPLSPGLKLKRIKILYQDESWEAALKERPRPSEEVSEITGTAGGGPKWPPDSTVDVIVTLENGEGKIYQLKVTQQRIEKTF